MSDGQPPVTPLGHGRFLVAAGDRQRLAYAVVAGTRTWIFIDGRTYVVDAGAHTSRRSGQHDDPAALAAPMPATVVTINVAAGQTVGNGDVLIVLEAMKMELPIKAPREARVTAINCRVGELVQPGVPLLELE